MELHETQDAATVVLYITPPAAKCRRDLFLAIKYDHIRVDFPSVFSQQEIQTPRLRHKVFEKCCYNLKVKPSGQI